MNASSPEIQEPRIGTARVGNAEVLTPAESLTWETCDAVDRLIEQCVARNHLRVVVDAKRMPFVDSKGLELLARWHDQLKGLGGALKIAGLNPVCRDIFLATRLIHILNVYQDLPEALRSTS